MTTLTEAKHAAEFILEEGNGNISRDNITIAASQTVLVGSILSASGGEYSVISAAPTAGDVLAIAIYPVTTGEAENVITAAITRMATVNGHCLSYPDSFTESDMEATNAVLDDQLIIVRGTAGTEVVSPSP